MPAPAADRRGGRREANKRDKLERIRSAARTVFQDKGYDDATVREIATSAGVAFGTLFLYARNKQELLLLLFDEQLPQATAHAYAQVDPKSAFIDQLIQFFGDLYAFYSRTPELSRDMLREISFEGSEVSVRVRDGLDDLEEHLARLVARAQADACVSADLAPRAVARVLFSLYRVEIRFCFDAPQLEVAASLRRLRGQFELVARGLTPR